MKIYAYPHPILLIRLVYTFFSYTDVSKTGQRAKITLAVVSVVLFAVFIAFCTLLGTFLGSLMQGNIICGMDCNLNSTWNVI